MASDDERSGPPSSEETHTATHSVRSRRGTLSSETATLPGPAHLVVLVGPEAGRLIPVEDGVELGRDVEGPGVLEDDGVSRRHVRINCSKSDEYTIEDLGSRNGTYVNGARVAKAPLHSGDKLAVGARTILLFTRYGRYEEHIVEQQKMQA
ncbi:MAG: FHA domain-containing protein, partial [Nannocystaceae bacterium]|nr:FHA domain-containing protein [Nannocystaceae bacterium]